MGAPGHGLQRQGGEEPRHSVRTALVESTSRPARPQGGGRKQESRPARTKAGSGRQMGEVGLRRRKRPRFANEIHMPSDLSSTTLGILIAGFIAIEARREPQKKTAPLNPQSSEDPRTAPLNPPSSEDPRTAPLNPPSREDPRTAPVNPPSSEDPPKAASAAVDTQGESLPARPGRAKAARRRKCRAILAAPHPDRPKLEARLGRSPSRAGCAKLPRA